MNVREKRWSKQPYLATSREDLREAKLRIFSCSACVCGVMDARGKFGEHEKMRKSSSRRSRGQLQLFECSPNFPSALSLDIRTAKSVRKFFHARATTRICAKKPFIVIECKILSTLKKVNKRPYWLVKNTPHFILWFEREHLIQLTDKCD